MINVKLDPEAANSAHFYHLKSGTIYSQQKYQSYETINKVIIR